MEKEISEFKKKIKKLEERMEEYEERIKKLEDKNQSKLRQIGW